MRYEYTQDREDAFARGCVPEEFSNPHTTHSRTLEEAVHLLSLSTKREQPVKMDNAFIAATGSVMAVHQATRCSSRLR